MTLYEIAQDYQIFLEQIEAGEIPEEAVEDTLDSMAGEFREKADQIACVIKNLRAEAAAIKEEEAALYLRRKAKETRADRLSEYLKIHMLTMGIPKLETSRNQLKISKNRASVKIDHIPEFVQWAQEHADNLLTYKAPEPSKTKIKEYLDAGGELPGVQLDQGQSLQIK